jgi:hypothetical protein
MEKKTQTPKYFLSVEKPAKVPKEPKPTKVPKIKIPKAEITKYKIYFCINYDKEENVCYRPYTGVLHEEDKKDILNISKISSYEYDGRTYIQLHIKDQITENTFKEKCLYINNLFDKKWSFTYKVDKTIYYKYAPEKEVSLTSSKSKLVFINDE